LIVSKLAMVKRIIRQRCRGQVTWIQRNTHIHSPSQPGWRANRSDAPVVAISGMRLCLRSQVQVDVNAIMEPMRATPGRAGMGVVAGLAGMLMAGA
jgi:hypothetical protein